MFCNHAEVDKLGMEPKIYSCRWFTFETNLGIPFFVFTFALLLNTAGLWKCAEEATSPSHESML